MGSLIGFRVRLEAVHTIAAEELAAFAWAMASESRQGSSPAGGSSFVAEIQVEEVVVA